LGGIVLVGFASGGADTRSKADGWLVSVGGIAGLSITESVAGGWIGLPFVAGSLPDDITAIVWVSSALDAGVLVNGNVLNTEVSVGEVVASVTAESLDATMEMDTAGATIETNEISADAGVT
jgi:hypothetical protein